MLTSSVSSRRRHFPFFSFSLCIAAKPSDLRGSYLAYISIEKLRNANTDLDQETLKQPPCFHGCFHVRLRTVLWVVRVHMTLSTASDSEHLYIFTIADIAGQAS